MIDKLAFLQHLSRVWRRYLTADEYALVSYIADRTTNWGRVTFRATVEQMLEGTERFAPLNLTRRSYYRASESLIEKGMISRKRLRECSEITIILDWTEAMLPVPKRLKQAKPTPEEGSGCANVAHQMCQSGTPITYSVLTSNLSGCSPADAGSAQEWGKLEEENREEGREEPLPTFSPVETESEQYDSAAEPDGVADGLSATERLRAKIMASSVAGRAKAQAKASKISAAKTQSTTDIETLWRVALNETFPSALHVMWSLKDKGKLKQVMKKWSFGKDASVGDLAEFAVRNWTQIVTRKFAWMTKPAAPSTPDIGFFCWKINAFLEAMMSDELQRFANSTEADAYERFKAKGMTHDEALRAMAKDEAVLALRAETEAKLSAARRLERDASRKLEKAERLDGLAERHPDTAGLIVPASDLQGWARPAHVIHPRSEAARRLAAATPALTPTAPSVPVPDLNWDFPTPQHSLPKRPAVQPEPIEEEDEE